MTISDRRRNKGRRKRILPPGGRPGEIFVDPTAESSRLTLIAYDETNLTEKPDCDSSDLNPSTGGRTVKWLDITGLGDKAALEAVARLFDVHPLALEDIVNVPQRPKVEAYDDRLFLVVQFLPPQGRREQIGLYLGPDFVLTFQERPGDPFDPVRERLRQGRGRLRRSGPDYLAYALLDAVIDHYFPLLEALQDRLYDLESELRRPRTDAIERIQAARSELTEARRAIIPMKDVTRTLLSQEWTQFGKATRIYLRDCRDHVLEASEQLESCREITQGLMDVHLSTMNHQANQTMKILTVIATVFMPLSFLAGVYGMNFNPEVSWWNMPELNSPIGYPVALAVMGVVGLGLLFVFWRKKWFD